MKAKLVLIAMMVIFPQFGCIPMPSSGPRCNDPDEDGFCNLSVPEGVDENRVIAIAFDNELTKQQLIGLVPGQVPGIVDQLEIKIHFSVTRTYENADPIPYSESRTLGTFHIQLEAACPQKIDVSVSVSVKIPIVNTTQTVFSDSLTFVQGGENSFECNQLFRVTAALDEATGQPAFTATSEPLP